MKNQGCQPESGKSIVLEHMEGKKSNNDQILPIKEGKNCGCLGHVYK